MQAFHLPFRLTVPRDRLTALTRLSLSFTVGGMSDDVEPTEHHYDHVPWPDPDAPEWIVTLHWQPVGGRMECVGFEVRSDTVRTRGTGRLGIAPSPVTASMARSLPLGRIITESRRKLADQWVEVSDLPNNPSAPGDKGRAERFGRGKRRDYGDEHYEAVAEVYAHAWRAGEPPTRTVQEWAARTYHGWDGEGRPPVSRSAAANWVSTCRAMGLLAPTEQRRAGGVPDTDGKDDQ